MPKVKDPPRPSLPNAVKGRNLRKATELPNSETRNQRMVSEAAAIIPVQRCLKDISLGSHPATEMGGTSIYGDQDELNSEAKD